jgi:hypothetical protein
MPASVAAMQQYTASSMTMRANNPFLANASNACVNRADCTIYKTPHTKKTTLA